MDVYESFTQCIKFMRYRVISTLIQQSTVLLELITIAPELFLKTFASYLTWVSNRTVSVVTMPLALASQHKQVGLELLLYPIRSNVICRTASFSIGLVLPIYSTCKAIENGNDADQKKHLIYWAAYGSFTIAETFTDKLLYWFPYYYQVKFAFLVWLQLPPAEGATQIYTDYLHPLFLKHQSKVDKVLEFSIKWSFLLPRP